MKFLRYGCLILAVVTVFTACAAPPEANTADEQGFEFSENDVAESGAAMVFTENEAAEGQVEEANTIELEDQYLPADGELVPVLGDWKITHDPGTVTCAGVSLDIPASEPEIYNFDFNSASEVTWLAGETPEPLGLELVDYGPGGAEYHATVTIDGNAIEFTFYFLRNSQTENGFYNFLEGFIKSEVDGCVARRSFSGRPVE